VRWMKMPSKRPVLAEARLGLQAPSHAREREVERGAESSICPARAYQCMASVSSLAYLAYVVTTYRWYDPLAPLSLSDC
jgi:cell division septal protein FtsQ